MNSCLHRSMNTGVRTQSQLPTRELQRSSDHIPPVGGRNVVVGLEITGGAWQAVQFVDLAP